MRYPCFRPSPNCNRRIVSHRAGRPFFRSNRERRTRYRRRWCFSHEGQKEEAVRPHCSGHARNLAIKGRGEATFVYESWSEEKGDDTDGGLTSTVNIFAAPNNVEFHHLDKPQGFAAAILLRNYLSKIDS